MFKVEFFKDGKLFFWGQFESYSRALRESNHLEQQYGLTTKITEIIE